MKRVIIIALFVILLLSPIQAQTVVQVQEEQKEEDKNIFSGLFSILKSPLVWGVMLFVIIGVVLLVFLFFLIRWLIKFIKTRSDIFYRMKTERMKLAKMHRRYNSKHWWKVEKNTPIRFIKMRDGKPHISNPIAHHRGDYITHEGNAVISMNLISDKHWFIFPKTSMLLIPHRDNIKLPEKSPSGKRKVVEVKNLPTVESIVQFNENEILLYAESLSSTGLFYIPVIKDKDDRVIDLSMPTYESLKEVVISDYLYEQTDEFSKLAKKSMDINPNIRAEQKIRDTSQALEQSEGT